MDAKMLENCFVDELSGSVKLIDTLSPTAESQSPTRSYQFFRLQDLSDFLEKPESRTYSCRLM